MPLPGASALQQRAIMAYRNRWCGRSGSNRHSFRNRILSPARLPISPRPHCGCASIDLHSGHSRRRFQQTPDAMAPFGRPVPLCAFLPRCRTCMPPAGRKGRPGAGDLGQMHRARLVHWRHRPMASVRLLRRIGTSEHGRHAAPHGHYGSGTARGERAVPLAWAALGGGRAAPYFTGT